MMSDVASASNTHWLDRSCFDTAELAELEKNSSHPTSTATTSPVAANSQATSQTRNRLSGGGGPAQLSQRVFHYVDSAGNRKRDACGNLFPSCGIPVFSGTGKRGPGPIDVVRKIAHRVLGEKYDDADNNNNNNNSDADARRPALPSSVIQAVSRAARRNFMCRCTAPKCSTPETCADESEARAGQYLASYMSDPRRTFRRSVTVCVREQGKPSVRRYSACYRRIATPSAYCIENGIRKEIVAVYEDAFVPGRKKRRGR
jgi:hypothetical protein